MIASANQTKLPFKTVFLSDIHLGSPHCDLERIIDFLSNTTCEKLILNGDFVDGWSLARRGGWNHRASRCIRLILEKAFKDGTELIYVRGNHDDFLDYFLSMGVGPIRITHEYIHKTREGDYLVIHGDGLDGVTTNHKWLAVLGDVAYQAMMSLNLIYNRIRKIRNLPYHSLSQIIKAKVKSAVAFVGKYEDQLQAIARSRGFRGIICGHIHTPADKFIGDLHYLNSGDWVESHTALVEHCDGGFEVIAYDQFRSWLDERAMIDSSVHTQTSRSKLRNPSKRKGSHGDLDAEPMGQSA